MKQKKIAVFIGSLRKESFNRKMAMALIGIAPASVNLEIIEIGDLSFYNQDFDENPPISWIKLREDVKAFDGVLFITPEYNRSVSAVLKNALDIGSRPYGKSVWDGKPGAVMTVSPSAMGGFGANHHLRQSLVFLNIPTMQQPEAYIGGADKMFGVDGSISSEATREYLGKFMNSFAQWVDRNSVKNEELFF